MLIINMPWAIEEEAQDWGIIIPQVGKYRGIIRGLRG
jgi:hypothetical protein